MSDGRILDQSLIKDLSNHIYEKRKATAFQIEGLTKSAVQRDDIQSVHKIIEELTELTNGASNSAKMGAITALGSVSVALGSFAIAYFLEQIIKPVFATFRDTDARVRYYACESLYNIAKIARGEILLYFNEVFDILCILVTDIESSVKNAADILDRLIKDIVSAKSTNYVSILQQHEQEDEVPSLAIASHVTNSQGVAIQVNQVQDVKKAFSLPKFIPTLLERMYTIDPFAKRFLIGWLELFDDIPALELITFLPNFLEPLIKFLMNNCPSDVRIETQNLLSVFLKEIKSISKVKFEIKKRQLIQERERKVINPESKSQDSESLADDIKDLKLKLTQEDDDAVSIKSNETTIVHKPAQPLAANDSFSADGSEFSTGQDIFIDYPKLIDILLSFLRIPNDSGDLEAIDLSTESHDVYLEIQITILQWLQEILSISPTSFVRFLPDCVSTIIKSISNTDANKDIDLRNQFLKLNLSVQDLIIHLNESAEKHAIQEEKSFGLDADKKVDDLSDSNGKLSVVTDDDEVRGLTKDVYDEFIEIYLHKTLQGIVTECLTCTNEFARITSLDWLIFLYSKNPHEFFRAISETQHGDSKDAFDLTSLIKSSADSSNEVILKVLQLLSQISESNQDFFKSFMVKLIRFFEADGLESSVDKRSHQQAALPRSKIEFIIRKLCLTLSSEKIYKTVSEVLASYDEGKVEFLSSIVVTLNNILLTTQELAEFRKKLKNLDVYKIEDWNLFASLFQSWCHSPPSALSLCLLSSNYELSYLIIKNLAELEVTFQLLTQLDILVQLLETPIFLKLRLQLLEPEKNPHLYKTLYGILMILPQSSTFNTLLNRLSSLPHIYPPSGVMSSPLLTTTPVSTPGGTISGQAGSNNSQLSIKKKRTYEMLDKFSRIQEKHEQVIANRKLKESLYSDEMIRGYSRSNGDHVRPDRLLRQTSTAHSYFGHEDKTKRNVMSHLSNR